MGNSRAFFPVSPRQVLSRCLRPAGVEPSLTLQLPGRVGPRIGPGKRCVPVASVASPVASALHTPKSALKGGFQNLKRAVWREKFLRLAGLLPQNGNVQTLASLSTASYRDSGTRA